MKTKLGLFLREPQEHKVKKRLAKTVGSKKALDLYIWFVKRTILRVTEANLKEPPVYFCWPPEGAKRISKIFNIGENIVAQQGDSLGEKMSNALHHLCEDSDAGILIGTDSPTLPAEYIKAAEQKLKINDLVIGPAADGGYYLIGMNKKTAETYKQQLFHNIEWGNSSVFQTTLERANNENISTHVLPLWNDIDIQDDLYKIADQLSVSMHYTKLSANYDEKWKKYNSTAYEAAAEFLPENPGKVLDAGCGTGNFIKYVKGKELFGVDANSSMLQIAKSKGYKNISEGDLANIPHNSSSFNIVVTISALHYSPNCKPAFEEFHRLLKNDGKLILVDWSDTFMMRIKKWWMNKFGIKVYLRSDKEFTENLSQVGFNIEKKSYVNIFPGWRLTSILASRT